MVVRWATVDDAEQLAGVHVETWRAAYTGVLPDDYLAGLDREARSRWWRKFIHGGARVHVADEGGVVGFCHADSSDDDRWGEIYSLYVSPAYWGQGHGRALLSAGEATLLARGHTRAVLWVLEGNVRARRFYQGRGWAEGKPIRLETIGGAQVTELRYEKDLTDSP